MIAFPKYGLYAITQTEKKSNEVVLAEVAAAIRGGAAVIQYRDKTDRDRLSLAQQLVELCHAYTIPLLINDDVELALLAKADGVHLGKDDGDIIQARSQLDESAIIGVSCYNDLTRAKAAQNDGATYIAFGRFFPSSSKPLASPSDLEILRQAKSALHLPIVAIGGILPSNGSQILDAGADLLAVIGGIFDDEPEQSALAFKPLFKK